VFYNLSVITVRCDQKIDILALEKHVEKLSLRNQCVLCAMERMRIDVCDLGKTEVILGIPWLAVHNPEIN